MVRNTNFLILPPSWSIALDLQEILEDGGCFIWLIENEVLMGIGERRPSILWMLFVFPFDSNHARNFASISTLTLGVSCLLAELVKFPMWHERAARLTVLTDSWYSAGFWNNKKLQLAQYYKIKHPLGKGMEKSPGMLSSQHDYCLLENLVVCGSICSLYRVCGAHSCLELKLHWTMQTMTGWS